ncbi:MAG TPA: hypothetical protein GXZ48_07080 [Acholeplasmataceae bacterium]|nr:hypothetical protein [Acholeplasmataceae bacterium]
MKKNFKKYLWLWEFIAVAFILALGLVAKFVPNLLVLLIGIAFVVFGIFRIIPLIKTTGDRVLKWFYAVEVLISIVAGAVLIVLYYQEKDVNKIFGYIIGGVFYLRALIFFYATALRNEETDFFQFLLHIIFVTLGSAIIARGGFDPEDLGWVILIVAIITSGFIGFSGYNHYRNYRNEKAAIEITKKVQKEKIEVPTSEEIITPEDEIVIRDEEHKVPDREKSHQDEAELR